MKQTTKIKEVDDEIKLFKSFLNEKYGVEVVILTQADNVYRLTIPETGEIVNNYLTKYAEQNGRHMTVQTKSRREDRVLHHQAFCKICRDMNYGVSEIGRYLHKDHSTIIYSIRRATDLLYIGDNRFLTVYNSIKTEILNTIENGRDIQHITAEQNNTQSALHAVLS